MAGSCYDDLFWFDLAHLDAFDRPGIRTSPRRAWLQHP
jgi:hypothetical protein